MENHKTDDRMEDLMQKVREGRGTDAACMLDYCTQIEEYAERAGDARLLGFSHYYKGRTYYLSNETGKVFEEIGEALGYLEQFGQWELVAAAYNLMAIVSVGKGNLSFAIEYYLAGLKYCKKYELIEVESRIESNLGSLYMECGQYSDARDYLEQAHLDYKRVPEEERSLASLTAIYNNLALCYMKSGSLEKAEEYIRKLETECEAHFEEMDYIYVNCMRARYCHLCGNISMRDQYIADIQNQLSGDVLILDLFDDLYDFCELMLEIDRGDVCRNIGEKLKALVEQTGIANMQRKMTALEMDYVKKTKDRERYLKTAGRFYELTEIVEQENRSMIVNMLYLRKSLERARERCRKLEEDAVELTEKSERDPLTGLANRYRLTNDSEKIVEQCFAEHKPLSFEILDIDYFKQYNDRYGHQAGDDCVRAIAALIRQMESDQIFCARYGGDEFVIIYSGMSAEEVCERAEKLRQDVMALQIEQRYTEGAFGVTISQGICHDIPSNGNKNWDFLHIADQTLYRAKRGGKNCLCMTDIHGREIEV